ncbi:glycosyl hydrolase 115 family protein [Gracilibacillus sp. JCM 18860]|uniref:glycosyl hydrolase 115 family protein n=1 Tax=Gracilibacillus sp. JCM 18860 TaxID=1306159 RepID=UPI000AD1DA2B
MIHSFILDNNVLIKYPQNRTTPIQHGISMFERDFKKVFQSSLKETEQEDNATIVIRYAEEDEPVFHRQESYSIRFIKREKTVMHVVGSDDLGIIYGLLHISNEYFGIDPFWFWADLEVETKEQVRIPIKNYASIEPVVRYRGWFVNDEVCLIGWKPEYPPTEEVWYPVFEALLRCGGEHGDPWNGFTEAWYSLSFSIRDGGAMDYASPCGATRCRDVPQSLSRRKSKL